MIDDFSHDDGLATFRPVGKHTLVSVVDGVNGAIASSPQRYQQPIATAEPTSTVKGAVKLVSVSELMRVDGGAPTNPLGDHFGDDRRLCVYSNCRPHLQYVSYKSKRYPLSH